MEQLLNWIKLPKNVAWPIVFVTGVLLWGPKLINKGLGLDLFINQYRLFIGVAFLFFIALGLMPLFPWLFNFLKSKYIHYKGIKKSKTKLVNLTPEEKKILKLYLDNNTITQNINIQDGNVSNFIAIKFLIVAYNTSFGGRMGSHTFPVNINEWLWNYLKKHPEILK